VVRLSDTESEVVRIPQPAPVLTAIMKTCPNCKETKPLNEFYTRRGTQTHSWCKPCIYKQTVDRQRFLKKMAIEYKGGSCHDCGIVDHPSVYDFHHVDPSCKDFSLGQKKQYSFNELIKKELDKCLLLCSNCHRKRHAKY